MGIPKDDMKPIQLYRDEWGKIVDKDGMSYLLPQKEILAENTKDWRQEGGLDISGSVTITGNLIVQQSEWVYLRGPITGSAALINGPITASHLLIRKSRGNGEMREEWGRVEIEGELIVEGVNLLKRINELEWKLNHLMSGSEK